MNLSVTKFNENSPLCFIQFSLKAGRINKYGCTPIQVEAKLNRRLKHYSTHIIVSPEQWDSRKRIIIDHPHATELNIRLKECIALFETSQIELWKQGLPISIESVEQHLNGGMDFIEYMDMAIRSANVRNSTKSNRQTTVKLLKRYAVRVGMHCITSEWLFGFQQWLFRQQMHTNTVAKHLSHLRIYVNMAISDGLMYVRANPFTGFRIRSVPSSHTFLQSEELGKLEHYAASIRDTFSIRSHCLDAFLFCCYTGLRYSDFINLNPSKYHIENGIYWLSFTTRKTGTSVKLPVSLLFNGKALLLVSEYERYGIDFYKLPSNQLADFHLGNIACKAGVITPISFHTARHTNATLLINKGVSMTTVQKLLGHTSLRMTEKYCKLLESTVIKELEQTF